MASDSPFFLSKVECPICRTINEFETVRVGAYYERGPKEIEWRYPRYQAYDPLVFFTATCSHCYYTREFTNGFKDWKNDGNFKTYRLKPIKEKHLEKMAMADSFVKKLGEAIDLSRFPNESGILKLHLAIFDELLSEHPSQLDLGRFYLRIGWIFRHLEKGEDPNLQQLKGLLLELDNKYGMMAESLNQFEEETEIFSRYVAAHFEAKDIPSSLSGQMIPFREKFENDLISLKETIPEGRARLERLDALITEYKGALLGGSGHPDTGNFGQFSGLIEFLLDVKRQWNRVVVNEREALEQAVRYYKEAFSEGRGIAPGNQQIQASYLIAELSRRIGDHDGAKQYFNSTIKHGQEFIYQNRRDQSRTALARKILELAIEQGRENIAAVSVK